MSFRLPIGSGITRGHRDGPPMAAGSPSIRKGRMDTGTFMSLMQAAASLDGSPLNLPDENIPNWSRDGKWIYFPLRS